MMDQEGEGTTDWKFWLSGGSFTTYKGETLRQAIHSFFQDGLHSVGQLIGITPCDGRFDGLTKIETAFALKAYHEGEN